MYHKTMTIKRRLFISNIRMIFISFGAFILVARMVMILYGTLSPNREAIAQLLGSFNQEMLMSRWILVFGIFTILVTVINGFLTHRMTSRIVKPLEPLSEGVRQIQADNLAYRIDYQNNDEFRPVCNAFNDMAAKLESSTAQQKKEEVNRRELIAGISHDLRTPLTSIKGCIEGIETGVASTPEMRDKYLAIIKNKTAVMEHIIEQLFLFSKLDMDEFPLNLRRVDITHAISDMVEDSLPEYTSRGLEIKFAEMPKDIYLSADVIMLRNVIINILENSVKYKTKEHGQVEISAAIEDNYFALRLSDNGPGVQADMLPKLFDVFYRTDPSRSKLGSGLGLAISGKIIERMNGVIYAEQSAFGGLTIVIKLPLTKEEIT